MSVIFRCSEVLLSVVPSPPCIRIYQSRTQTLIPTSADRLHHRYVERGSGELLYSILSTVTRMLGNQSDSRYRVIAYLSYYKELLVIAMMYQMSG